MPTVAIYAGSFDPITRGHEDVIRRSRDFVDRLVVAIATNSTKQPLFSVDERLRLMHDILSDDPAITITTFNGLLVDFAASVGASLIIRGLRAVSDFEYEFQMALMNRHMSPKLETVFMVPSVETTYISSSIVREVAKYGGDLSGVVHPAVAAALREKFAPHASGVTAFFEQIRARAAAICPRIVYPESSDPRVLSAAEEIERLGIARPILLVSSEAPLMLAADMVAAGDADAFIAGAVYSTADVLRAAIKRIGTAPGVTTVSGAFYMVASGPWEAPSPVLTFTDCSVVPYPTATQLADIALAAAADRRRIVGDEPVVAFLSFSTAGSARGNSVDLMREGVELVRSRDPQLLVDGELQGDAALVLSVGRQKAPASLVAGRANILVFPSLDAGNIAYKLVQRLGGVAAVGPILQGLARPVADLSRGASVDDIINVTAITALQTTL